MPNQVRYDPSKTIYSESVRTFVSRLSANDRQRQEMEAINRLLKNFFERMQRDLDEELPKGHSVVATADAYFIYKSQRMTAVILGELSLVEGNFALTVEFMLPDEFDKWLKTQVPANPFEKERDEALLSMDESLIRAFGARHNTDMPKDALEFWMLVHTNREQTPSLPMEERQKSKQWLDERRISRPPGPFSLDERPSLALAYPMVGAIYVQPVFRQEPDKTYTVWLELIRMGKVIQRNHIRGIYATQEAAVEAGVDATAEMIRQIQAQNPDLPSFTEPHPYN